MGRENFVAHVQYGDLKGTAAADRHDQFNLKDYLEEKGLIQEGETLIAVRIFSGEVHERTQDKPVYVSAFITQDSTYDSIRTTVDSGEALQVREERFTLPLNEIFGLFKRLEICISTHGLIDGKEIEVI
tara:strand:+ start:180 stop:566 length:387 start_codon:yes stop_codon:yes gene_type:complete